MKIKIIPEAGAHSQVKVFESTDDAIEYLTNLGKEEESEVIIDGATLTPPVSEPSDDQDSDEAETPAEPKED